MFMKRHLNEQTKEILRILSDGKFHSGEEMGEIIHQSRTSVGRNIRKLQELGLEIYSIKGRGFALPYNIELFDEKRINRECGGADIQVFDMIDSTNRYMMTYLDTFRPGSCILAETQTMGVGRGSTRWFSPFGGQLILSMYWNCNRDASISGLSLAVGLATVKTLESFGIRGVGLKWPNDIYAEQKKLAGILIESKVSLLDGFQIVIGIGMNLINTQTMQDKHLEAIGLENICDNTVSKNDLAIALIREYRKSLEDFNQYGFRKLYSEWNKRDVFQGCKVKLMDKYTNNFLAEGKERGVNEHGSLIIETSKGILETFHIGDISLRK